MDPARSLPPTLSDYMAERRRHGLKAIEGSQGTWWVSWEGGALMRFPTWARSTPTFGEATGTLLRAHRVIASYTQASAADEANAILFLCREYQPDSLSKAVCRNLRRAERMLRIGPLSWDEVMLEGYPAYRDTRSRVGLSDGTPPVFQRRFGDFSRVRGHHAFGARTADGRLVAFMTVIRVDDWAEIESVFFTTADGGLRPNNGLAHYALDRWLRQEHLAVVSYGLSSMQRGGNDEGLRDFKVRIGFDAVPVRRVFTSHPICRPLVNRLSLRVVEALLTFAPRSRRLRKAGGVLATLLEDAR